LRDTSNDGASYQIAVDVKHTFEVRISQTQKASGPPSPEYRIKEKTRELLLNSTLPPPGAVVSFGCEIDPRYF